MNLMNTKSAAAAGAAFSVGLGAVAMLAARAAKAVRAGRAPKHGMTIRGTFAQGTAPGAVSNKSALAVVAAIGLMGQGAQYTVSTDGTREHWELCKNGVWYEIARRGGVCVLRVEVSPTVRWECGAQNTPAGAVLSFQAHGGTPPAWVHELAGRVLAAMVS